MEAQNLEKQKDYSIICKIYFYVKDPYEAKYQYLIKKSENNYLKNLKNSKAFIECSNSMQDVYRHIKEYNPSNIKNIKF